MLCQCSFLFDLKVLDEAVIDDAGVLDSTSGKATDGFASTMGSDDGPGALPADAVGPIGDESQQSVAEGPSGNVPEGSTSGPEASFSDARDGGAMLGTPESGGNVDGSPPQEAGVTLDSGPNGSNDSGSDGVAPAPDTGAGRVCDPAKPFGPPAILTTLQSTTKEGDFRLLPNELTGFFWSARWDAGAAALYVTIRTDTGSSFGNVTLLNNVNSTSTQYDPSVTGNGLTLAFRSDHAADAGRDDLYWASRATVGSDFSAVAPISNLNSPSNDVQPFMTPSGAEIYFSSDRTGDYDIYRATGSAGAYGAPTPVSEVNMTVAIDQNPVVSADDLTILFSSDRAGGLGGKDIWIATRSSASGPFGAPGVLAGVNTTANDYPGWLSVDGCRLYLHSDVSGATHIYLATRPQ
jgi:Tol biopolymer transport system component